MLIFKNTPNNDSLFNLFLVTFEDTAKNTFFKCDISSNIFEEIQSLNSIFYTKKVIGFGVECIKQKIYLDIFAHVGSKY